VKNQTVARPQQVIAASGFFKPPPVVVEVDSPSPKGQVVGTLPAEGENVSMDPGPIQVSKGNQLVNGGGPPKVARRVLDNCRARLRNAIGWRAR